MHRRFVILVLSIALIAIVAFAPAQAAAANAPCTVATFTGLFPDTTITVAQVVLAAAPLPEYCKVHGIVNPKINFEVWMPTTTWNGKFEGVGNGGLAGSISFSDMRTALARNYATAGTDTGHSTNLPPPAETWWTNAQQLKDYGYRSIHETAVKAKAIITAFYGAGPRLSYFNGCSTGGRQAFMESQRYPHDYNGIIAGSPVFRVIQLRARHVWTWQANHEEGDNDPHAIPFSKLPMIFNAVVAACDARDGLVDGQVDNPRRCNFKPKSLLCTGADSPTCLTAPQVEALEKMYAGPRNPRTGELIYPGIPKTSELDQAQSIGPVPNPSYTPFFAYTVFENVNYDFRTFNFDSDMWYSLHKVFGGETLEFIHNADDPDLSEFKEHHGKMIIWHPESDPLPNPVDTIRFYENVGTTMRNRHGHDEETQDFLRLFLLPMVGHCGGDSAGGPNTIDLLTALEQWVEQGLAPDKIIASRPAGATVPRTRPICAYPLVARYTGTGSINDAANFVCKFEGPGHVHER